jgi:hypothetical protein
VQRNFDSWQDNDTFGFTIEGERKGETFTFSYNIQTATLICSWPGCAADQPGENSKSPVKPVEVLPASIMAH